MITLKRIIDTEGKSEKESYEVSMDKDYILMDFITQVLNTRRRDWGKFEIASLGLCVEYRYGMMKKPDWSTGLLYAKVSSVQASGGFTRMDYFVTVEPDSEKDAFIGPAPFVNKDLFDDPRDLLIVQLKAKIESFKKYDASRKEYYSKSMQRLGMLESLIEEIKDCDSLGKLKYKIVTQQTQIENLLRIQGIKELYKKVHPDMVENVESIAKLLIDNQNLKEKIESLNYIISKLLGKEKDTCSH